MRLKYPFLILCLTVWLAACGTPPDPTIQSFTVSPSPVERGTELTLRWDAPGATRVSIWPMTYDRKVGAWYRVPAGQVYQSVSPADFDTTTGQMTIAVPDDARYAYRFELEATGASGSKVTATSEVVDLTCHPPLGWSDHCPFPVQDVKASYQPFERGFLIWREDTQEVFLFSTHPDDYLPWSLQSTIQPTRPIPSPPPGLHAPAERFAGLWSSLDLQVTSVSSASQPRTLPLGEILGWAKAPEQTYTMRMQYDLDNTRGAAVFDYLYLTLPDGQVMSLVPYDGVDGTTGPSWTIIDPG